MRLRLRKKSKKDYTKVQENKAGIKLLDSATLGGGHYHRDIITGALWGMVLGRGMKLGISKVC